VTGSQPPDAPEGRRSGSGLYVSADSGELEFERVTFGRSRPRPPEVLAGPAGRG